jgi:dihydropteridine reductase
VCTAGGWAGGNAADDGVVDTTQRMFTLCVQPSVTAAHVAGKHLKEGGTLVLTGAAAALAPTPGMLAYGMAKAATHHLVRSVGAPGGGLPPFARVVALLPRVIDTPNNRKFMPGQDTSTWTPVEDIAGKVLEWCERHESPRLASGSLVEAATSGGRTKWVQHSALYAGEAAAGPSAPKDAE